jgi:TraM recognition site of TraD and TraG/Helicase HerA, central domain
MLMNKNKHHYSNPLIEIMEELVKIILELIHELFLFGIKKLKNEVKPVPRKVLKVRKTTHKVESLGICLKTRKEFPLKNLDYTKHTFIVGASGFGKTNLLSLLQEDSMKRGNPVIFIDPKGDYESLENFKLLAKKHDKKVYVFSEFHPDSIALNPISSGSHNQIVDRIMCAFDWDNSYYRDFSRRKLYEALETLDKYQRSISIQNLTDILATELFHPDMLGILSKLEAIAKSDFGKYLKQNETTKTLRAIREEKACLYIGLSTQGYGETALGLGKIFLGELLYLSYFTLGPGRGDGHTPISIFFDEFGGLVTPNFIELLNKCRSAQMELTLAVQSPSDIDRTNSDLTKQIVENCANIFIFKQRLDSAASFFSEAIGTIPSIKETVVTENGSRQSKGSQREVNELLLHPDIIKSLNIGQCILLQHNPVRIDVLNVRRQILDPLSELKPEKPKGENNPLEIKQGEKKL